VRAQKHGFDPSTKDRLREPLKRSSDSAVLMGNPILDLNEVQQRAAVRFRGRYRNRANRCRSTSDRHRVARLRRGTRKPLPATQAEVQALSSLVEQQRWNVQTLTQQYALKEAPAAGRGAGHPASGYARILCARPTETRARPGQQKADQPPIRPLPPT